MDLHLKGKRVLITGASRGIGASAARLFAQEGCQLQLAARNGGALQDLTTGLRNEIGVDVMVHALDLRESAAIEQLAAAARETDVLVNNAGDIQAGSLQQVDESTWRHAWELKVFGYINLTRHPAQPVGPQQLHERSVRHDRRWALRRRLGVLTSASA